MRWELHQYTDVRKSTSVMQSNSYSH